MWKFADWSQLGALLVGGVGIGVALINQRRQLNAQMFVEFSKRFEELLRLFPTEAWLANRRPNQELPPSSKEITECTLYCLQFVADVFPVEDYLAGRIADAKIRGVRLRFDQDFDRRLEGGFRSKDSRSIRRRNQRTDSQSQHGDAHGLVGLH